MQDSSDLKLTDANRWTESRSVRRSKLCHMQTLQRAGRSLWFHSFMTRAAGSMQSWSVRLCLLRTVCWFESYWRVPALMPLFIRCSREKDTAALHVNTPEELQGLHGPPVKRELCGFLTKILRSIISIHEREGFSFPPGVLFSWLNDGLADGLDLILVQNLQSKRQTWDACTRSTKQFWSFNENIIESKVVNPTNVFHLLSQKLDASQINVYLL